MDVYHVKSSARKVRTSTLVLSAADLGDKMAQTNKQTNGKVEFSETFHLRRSLLKSTLLRSISILNKQRSCAHTQRSVPCRARSCRS